MSITSDLTSDIALERMQRSVAVMMADQINDAIDEQNSIWASRDAAWFAAMNRSAPTEDFVVEHIKTENIYSGIIPSLIQSPSSRFPNLSVIAYSATPSAPLDDWSERYSVGLALEFIVKALNDEELVNARIQRTLEAGHSVLKSDYNRKLPEIDGNVLVPQISAMPAVTISNVFVRHTSSNPNERSFYQHGVLNYRVEKFSVY